MSCAAFGCTRRHVKGSTVNFFRFPLADNDRLKQWLKNVRRKDWTPSSNSRLCSMHFEEDQFFLDKEGKRRLKDTAVPTIFVFQSHWFIQEEIKRGTQKSASVTVAKSDSLVTTPDPSLCSPSYLPQPLRRAEPVAHLSSALDNKAVTATNNGAHHNTPKHESAEKTKAVDRLLPDDIVKVVVYDDDDVYEVIPDDTTPCTTSRGTQTTTDDHKDLSVKQQQPSVCRGTQTAMHDHTYRRAKQQPISVSSADHSYVVSDSPKALKRKVEAMEDQLVAVHKKLKVKCQQTRRLESRLFSLKILTKDVKTKLKAAEKALAAAQKQGSVSGEELMNARSVRAQREKVNVGQHLQHTGRKHTAESYQNEQQIYNVDRAETSGQGGGQTATGAEAVLVQEEDDKKEETDDKISQAKGEV